MSLRLGKVGVYEACCLMTVSLTMNGLFCFDSETAYETGNSTYISIPIAIIISLLCFLLACSAMKKTNSPDLLSMLRYSLGVVYEKIFSILLTGVLLVNACILLNTFLNILHSYFFVEANYFVIAAFIAPIVFFLAWQGFETLTRTSKIIGFVAVFAHFFMLANSVPGLEQYKIYPIAGDGALHVGISTIRYSFLFLPLLLLLLCQSEATHGMRFAKKTGVIASVISFVICAVTQLAVAFSYTYTDLSTMYSPLYRLSMITGTENFIVRLDKATVFFWLMAAFIAISYGVYGVSYLYAKTFVARDIRPNIAIICLLVLTISLAAHVGNSLVMYLFEFISHYGFFILFVPVVVASAVALIKSCVRNKGECV